MLKNLKNFFLPLCEGEEGTDEGQQAGGEQQGQPSQQQQQQQQQRQQQPQAGATGGGQATGAGAGIRRNNVRVVNFPPVQVMMSRGLNPQQRQQQQAAAFRDWSSRFCQPTAPHNLGCLCSSDFHCKNTCHG